MTSATPAPPVLSYDPDNKSNADLIRDAARLRYVDVDQPVLDCTYGRGVFWRHVHPKDFTGVDIDPDLIVDAETHGRPDASFIVADFTDLPFDGGTFQTVVLDPPYKLNGTSSGKGPAASDRLYGVDTTTWAGLSWQEKHELIRAGITEGTRVLAAGGHLLVKCQDQVCSGQVRWQTRDFAAHAETLGHRLVDRLDISSYRAQPAGRRQVHARRTMSTLLVLRLERPDR